MMPNMGDTSEEGEEDEERSRSPGLNLTGFLFGNINEAGQLEDDGLLDTESKRHLSSLARLGGLRPLLREVMSDGSTRVTRNEDEDYDKNKSHSDSESDEFEDENRRTVNSHGDKYLSDDTDYGVKSPSAVDYSDITEVAEDDRAMLNSLEAPRIEDGVDYDADDEGPKPPTSSNQSGKSDIQLMPPPPPLLPPDKQSGLIPTDDMEKESTPESSETPKATSSLTESGTKIKEENGQQRGESGDVKQDPDKVSSAVKKERVSPDKELDKQDASNDLNSKKLETPLAAMLPSKYAGIDVTELFPDFRPDKVLRFSRLFGPGKASSLPQIWRSVRKRRRKHRKLSTAKVQQNAGSDSGSDQDSRGQTNGQRGHGWTLQYGILPGPEECASDDEEKLLQASEAKGINGTQDQGEGADTGPRVADWRFGPAQIWYDMLDVPET